MDTADLDAHITKERMSNEDFAWYLGLPVKLVDQFFGLAPDECEHEFDYGDDEGHIFHRCIKCGEDNTQDGPEPSEEDFEDFV